MHIYQFKKNKKKKEKLEANSKLKRMANTLIHITITKIFLQLQT